MSAPDASAAGTFRIGGDLQVNRMGFGAMRVTGKGIWGPPEDPDEARAVLRRLPELKVDFIDTADSYGPEVSENLIREVLHPYRGMVIATKAGFIRPGPDNWSVSGDPAYLRRATEASLKRLGVDRIDLWQLHRIDPGRPRDAQFEAIARMQADGLIRHVGLSEVKVADIEAAGRWFKVATVQNRYNLVDRGSEDVLDYCEANEIGFIPWYPLAAGMLNRQGSVLDAVAKAHEATPGQIALAWALRRSPVMLPIPGTGKVRHLEENVAAAAIRLTDEEFAGLDKAGREAWSRR
jgi:aryl-alcohol dehydrogenase-like predicted oxidoreductase